MDKSIREVDAFVKEYLHFRGFIGAIAAFEEDQNYDRVQGFNVDRLVDFLISHVEKYELTSLIDTWDYLDARFFSQMSGTYCATVKRLGDSLRRYYVINCIKNKQNEKVVEFFDVCSERFGLLEDPSWTTWFTLPYTQSPSDHPLFEPFFSQQWLSIFIASLRNFFKTVFSSIHPPKLVRYRQERLIREGLESDLNAARSELTRLRAEIASMNADGHNTGPGRKHTPRRTTVNLAKNKFHSPSQSALELDLDEGVGLRLGAADDPSASATSADPLGVATSRTATSSSYAHTPNTTTPMSGSALSMNMNMSRSRSFERDRDRDFEQEEEMGVISVKSKGDNNNGLNDDYDTDSSSGDNDGDLSRSRENQASESTSGSSVDAHDQRVRLESVLAGHTGPVTRTLFSPPWSDGSVCLASASQDGTVRVWEVESRDGDGDGRRRATILCDSPVLDLDWDPRSSQLLFCSTANGKVRIWHADGKRIVGNVDVGTEEYPRITTVCASPASPTLICGCSAPHKAEVGGFIGTSAIGGIITAWNVKTLQQTQIFRLDPNPTATYTIAMNHNGNMLFAGSSDGMIRAFDVRSAAPLMGWPAHEGVGGVMSLCLSNDETSVYSTGADGKVAQWNIHGMGSQIRSLELGAGSSGGQKKKNGVPMAMSMSIDSDGKLACVTWKDSRSGACILDLESFSVANAIPLAGSMSTLARRGRQTTTSGPITNATSIHWHPSKRTVVTGHGNPGNEVAIYNVKL